MGQVVFKKTKEKKKEPETIFFSPILKPSDCKTKRNLKKIMHIAIVVKWLVKFELVCNNELSDLVLDF